MAPYYHKYDRETAMIFPIKKTNSILKIYNNCAKKNCNESIRTSIESKMYILYISSIIIYITKNIICFYEERNMYGTVTKFIKKLLGTE